ncbi:hypothetical protein WA026_023134 [Henosepilachna vigintioctopunctata]|uniref:3-hydroxyacyl-CoA dehydrogenase NAD binding domain-containing protein n=1 Tax=Henosepilachna vigintioctopunctata TaxID=420089 RepID=A0AAW1TTE4_9CUCU
MEEEQSKIGIVGSGLIGRSWAMLYASVGHKCWIYDIKPEQVKSALNDIEHQLRCLEQSGLLRGKLNARQQMLCITGTTSLEEAVRGAMLIQECIPENLDLKKKLFNTIDGLIDHSTIIATSTSAFLPSALSEGLRHKKNFIVLHPVNPPYYVPLVEIIPAPWTATTVVDKTREMMDSIGYSMLS